MITEELKRTGDHVQIGNKWIDWLVVCAESFGDIANAAYYAGIVAEKHRKRELIRIAGQLVEAGYDDQQEAADVCASFGASIEAVASSSAGALIDVRESVRTMPQRLAGTNQYLKTGYAAIDGNRSTRGIELGALTVLGARPSVGKTSLAVNLCYAVLKHCAVAIYSIEMRTDSLADRLVAMLTGYSTNRLRLESPETREFARDHTLNQLVHNNMYIADRLRRVTDIVADARTAIRQKGVRMVAIDYLQLCRGGLGSNLHQQIGYITAEFKALAQDTGCAVLLLSQLNRNSANANRAPTTNDLRESGNIEEHADEVWLLHANETDRLTDATEIEVQFIRAKSRNGPTYCCGMRFLRARTLYQDISGETYNDDDAEELRGSSEVSLGDSYGFADNCTNDADDGSRRDFTR